MKEKQLPTIQDVVDRHLCSGCGVCAFANPELVEMVDTLEHSRRPIGRQPGGLKVIDAEPVCPVVSHQEPPKGKSEGIAELRDSWGNILEIWEGYAVDPEIRFKGSSGGVTTALALFAIEQKNMQGAVHVRSRQDAPLLNETVFSQDRRSLLEGSGSRYAPASPCDGLDQIARADRPCVFIGKPCDTAAVAKARNLRVDLENNLGLVMSVFCAGTPSLGGTLELARSLGADDPTAIKSIRYRGHGWPGEMTIIYRDANGDHQTRSMAYADGWGNILQRHRQWRCHVCADHTGELADLSIGDPWYRKTSADEPGRSLLLVRTERGRELVRQAIKAGYVKLEAREPEVLNASQPHLMRSQAAVWGRAVSTRLAGVGSPAIAFKRRFKEWLWRLSWKEKLQSLVGTWKRITKRRLRSAERATLVGRDGTLTQGSQLLRRTARSKQGLQ